MTGYCCCWSSATAFIQSSFLPYLPSSRNSNRMKTGEKRQQLQTFQQYKYISWLIFLIFIFTFISFHCRSFSSLCLLLNLLFNSWNGATIEMRDWKKKYFYFNKIHNILISFASIYFSIYLHSEQTPTQH